MKLFILFFAWLLFIAGGAITVVSFKSVDAGNSTPFFIGLALWAAGSLLLWAAGAIGTTPSDEAADEDEDPPKP